MIFLKQTRVLVLSSKLFNHHAPPNPTLPWQVFVALNSSEEIQVGWMDGGILQVIATKATVDAKCLTAWKKKEAMTFFLVKPFSIEDSILLFFHSLKEGSFFYPCNAYFFLQHAVSINPGFQSSKSFVIV